MISSNIISMRNDGFYKGINRKKLSKVSSGRFVFRYIKRNSNQSLVGCLLDLK